jgi:hypothetical protein
MNVLAFVDLVPRMTIPAVIAIQVLKITLLDAAMSSLFQILERVLQAQTNASKCCAPAQLQRLRWRQPTINSKLFDLTFR